MNAPNYNGCAVTGTFSGAKTRDTNIIIHFITQCWQEWYTPSDTWYFLTNADAVNAGATDITPVGGTNESFQPQAAASTSPKSTSLRVAKAAAPRLLGAAATEDVPIAQFDSTGDTTTVMERPSEIAESKWATFTVDSIANWTTKDNWSSTFGAKWDPDTGYVGRMVDRNDLDVCYVFSADNLAQDEYYSGAETKEEPNPYYIPGYEMFGLSPTITVTSAKHSAYFVVTFNKDVSEKSIDLFFFSNSANSQLNADKRVVPTTTSQSDYVVSGTPNAALGDKSDSGVLEIFYKTDAAGGGTTLQRLSAIPVAVAIKNNDPTKNAGVSVTVSLCQDVDGQRITRASFTHTIPAYKQASVVGIFEEYNVIDGKNHPWNASDDDYTDYNLKNDKEVVFGRVYSGTRTALETAFNAIENVAETGLENVNIAANEGEAQSKWVQIEWRGLVGVRNGYPMTTIAFEIAPQLRTISDESDTTRTITNEEIGKQEITFRLPLSNDFTARALVVHTSEDANYPEERSIKNVAGDPGARYVEITTTHFSTFTVSPIGDDDVAYVTSATGAFLGSYATLAAALAETTDGGTIYLLANNSDPITVSSAMTFSINAGTYTYSGTVTAGAGYKVENTTSGSVVTYTATALPVIATVTVNNGDPVNYYDLHEALEAGKPAGSVVTLLADVDLSGVNWVPVGTSADHFRGSFNGNGKTISNLHVDVNGDSAGLFGVVNGTSESVGNVILSNVYVRANNYVAAFAGGGTGNPYPRINNVVLTGTIDIRGHKYVGGIAGSLYYGSAVDCSVVGDETGIIEATYLAGVGDGENVGGITGHFETDNVLRLRNCSVSGVTIVGAAKVGGVTGVAFLNSIMENISAKDVKVGLNTDSAYTAAEGTRKLGVGGLVGTYYTAAASGKISGSVENVEIIPNGNGIAVSYGLVTGGFTASGISLPNDPLDTAPNYDYSGLVAKGYDETKYSNDYLINKDYVAMVKDANGAVRGGYSTLAAAVAAATDGDTIELLCDIQLSGTDSVAINKVGTYTIDGKGHTISPADDSEYVYHRFMFGQSGQSYDATKNYTVTNLVITGFSDSTYFIRSEGCYVTFADCTITNNLLNNEVNNAKDSTNRLMLCTSADMTIDGCVIANNSSHSNLIDFNSNGVLNEESGSLTVTGNLFKDNTLSGSGVIFSNGSAGTSDKIENNTFSGNTITTSAVAVLYLSGTVDSVSGNLFTGNTVTATGKEAVIVLGSKSTGTVVNGNAFVENTLPDGTTKYATFYTGANCDVSGNYWGDGEAPETGTGLDIRIDDGKTPTITVDSYATAYMVNANGRGVTVTLSIAITEADVVINDNTATITTAGNATGDKLWVKDGSGNWDASGITISGPTISGVPLPTEAGAARYYTVTKESTSSLTDETVEGNVIGALRVNSSLTNTIIAVPWTKIGGGAVTVSNLVATATLTEGDTLQAYDKDTRKYYQWTLKEDKTWEANKTATTDNTETAEGADAYVIPRGAGVWLTRQNPDKPLYLIGEVATGDAETALDAATTANTDGKQAWNLVAPPTAEAFSLSDIQQKGTIDRILVPTATVPRNYTYKDGEGWGYYKTTVDEKGRVTSEWTADGNATVPAGTGFWYLNSSSSSEESKIDWSK